MGRGKRERGCYSRKDCSVCTPVTAGIKSVLKEPIQGSGLPTLGQNRRWSHILANPRDLVRMRCCQVGGLEPRWKGQFTVILTTPMAIKVDGVRTWIHVGHVKRAEDENAPQRWMPLPMDPANHGLKLRLKKNNEFVKFIVGPVVKI